MNLPRAIVVVVILTIMGTIGYVYKVSRMTEAMSSEPADVRSAHVRRVDKALQEADRKLASSGSARSERP